MLSQKTKYALRALTVLAEQDSDDLTPILYIAERENIPRKFLEAILLDLRKAGILYAKRGKSGGYRLAKPASSITCAEVVRLLGGYHDVSPCGGMSEDGACDNCDNWDSCSTRWVMNRVSHAVFDILKNTTVADTLRHCREAPSHIADYMI